MAIFDPINLARMELWGADGHFSESPQDQFFLWSAAEEKKVIRRERWKKTEARLIFCWQILARNFLRLKNKESKICGLDLAGKNQWCGRRFYLPWLRRNGWRPNPQTGFSFSRKTPLRTGQFSTKKIKRWNWHLISEFPTQKSEDLARKIQKYYLINRRELGRIQNLLEGICPNMLGLRGGDSRYFFRMAF